MKFEHTGLGILLSQSAFFAEVIGTSNIEKAKPKTFLLPLGNFFFEKQKPLTDDELQNMKSVPYVKLGVSFLSLSTKTRLDLRNFVSMLAKHVAKSAPRHWTALKHLIKCFIIARDIAII